MKISNHPAATEAPRLSPRASLTLLAKVVRPSWRAKPKPWTYHPWGRCISPIYHPNWNRINLLLGLLGETTLHCWTLQIVFAGCYLGSFENRTHSKVYLKSNRHINMHPFLPGCGSGSNSTRRNGSSQRQGNWRNYNYLGDDCKTWTWGRNRVCRAKNLKLVHPPRPVTGTHGSGVLFTTCFTLSKKGDVG